MMHSENTSHQIPYGTDYATLILGAQPGEGGPSKTREAYGAWRHIGRAGVHGFWGTIMGGTGTATLALGITAAVARALPTTNANKQSPSADDVRSTTMTTDIHPQDVIVVGGSIVRGAVDHVLSAARHVRSALVVGQQTVSSNARGLRSILTRTR